jgi:hypothetical protein
MKKLLLFLVLALFTTAAIITPFTGNAQIVKKITVVKDSTVNSDFTTIGLPSEGTVKSFEVHATKVSGTIAGKAVLEGLAHDAINWVGIDSISLADQAVNFKVFAPSLPLIYSQYRIKVTETGTGKLKPIVAYSLNRN